jgi:ubiquinone/menaquinone biosynthesis C-methylase UbiE
MTRYVRLNELLLAVEGAALFRHLVERDDAFVSARVDGIRRQLAELEKPDAIGAEVPELDVEEGYAAWAPIYDEMDNALIRCEEPAVARALADVAPGTALDAACGTGRHAAKLVAAGHRTVGLDRSEAMLAVARAKVPDAEFRTGDFTAMPFDDATFDVAICALALTHLDDPEPAIRELARVVRPEGRVILTDAHPTFVLIQGQAMFPVKGGGLAYVRNHPHLVSRYLEIFRRAALDVVACDEPSMTPNFDRSIFAGAKEAAEALWERIPIALVWTLDRR